MPAPSPIRAAYSVPLPSDLPAPERLAEGLAAYFLTSQLAVAPLQPCQAPAAVPGPSPPAAAHAELHGVPGEMLAGEPDTSPQCSAARGALSGHDRGAARSGTPGQCAEHERRAVMRTDAMLVEQGAQPWQPGPDVTHGAGSEPHAEQLLVHGPRSIADRDATTSEHAMPSWQPGAADMHCEGAQQHAEPRLPSIVVGDSTASCACERWVALTALVLDAPAPPSAGAQRGPSKFDESKQ